MASTTLSHTSTKSCARSPIAVVDNDFSELSRRIVQTLDASGAVRVAIRAHTYPEARAALDRGKAFAVVEIPPGTERDVLKGISVHVPIYADATYLFIFRTMATGIELAIDTLTLELAARGARPDGSLVKATFSASASPADVLLQPIFNPVGGYASYIVPAAFVLILQQLLLIGASLLTVLAKAGPQGRPFTDGAWPRRCAPNHLCADAGALFHRAAAVLWLFHTWPAAADLRAGLIVHTSDKLHGPGRWCVVQASGNANTDLPCHQHSPAFPHRVFLAPGSHSANGASGGLYLPF